MKKISSKAFELINELRFNPKFEENVAGLRSFGGIPVGGFGCKDEFNAWHKELEFAEDFYNSLTQLSLDYKVPSNMFEYLETYFFYGDKLDEFKYKENVCELDQEAQIGTTFTIADANWADGRTPFVKVFISDNASLEEAQYFLKENWKGIQKKLSEQRGGPKSRLRRKTKLERDSRIRKLYKMTHKDLGLKRGDYSKEKHIRDLIKSEYGDILDYLTIRKIGSTKI